MEAEKGRALSRERAQWRQAREREQARIETMRAVLQRASATDPGPDSARSNFGEQRGEAVPEDDRGGVRPQQPQQEEDEET